MGSGLTLQTALIIQNYADTTSVATYGSEKSKFGFHISSIIREKYRPHLTSNLIYDSREKAEEVGVKLLEAIKKADLTEETKGLVKLMGPEADTIIGIAQASQS